MPYIFKDMRDSLDPVGMTARQPTTEGELNFTITSLCVEYLEQKGLNYAHINEVVGVLECAKLEMYRRVASPYEDKKIKNNGDVYRDEILTEK
jgi:hypothetical protein